MELNISILKEETLKEYNEILHKNKRWDIGYWDDSLGKERARICTRYLCESILKFNENDYEYRLSKHMFLRHKLINMVNTVYEGIPEKAVIDAMPEKEKIILRPKKRADLTEEIIQLVPRMLKNESTRKVVIEKVITYLDCEEKDIPNNLTYFHFSKVKLNDIFENYYNSSMYKFIDEVRPGVFKPWEFDQGKRFRPWFFETHSREIPQGYFKAEKNRIDAVVWLLDKLKNEGKKVTDLNEEMVSNYGLFTLMGYYKGSVFSMIDEFFKGKTRPWHFKESGTAQYWNDNPDVAKEGILKLIDKLGLTKDAVPSLTLKDFTENHLSGMLFANYGGLISAAIDSVYPGEYHHMKWWFNDIPDSVFDVKENRQKAIQSLVEKMCLTEDKIPLSITKEVLDSNKFGYILNNVHKGNVFLVIDEAFPNKFNKDVFRSISVNIEEYIDLFKDSRHTKLSFTNVTEDDIKKGLKILGEIFTINTNSWVGHNKLKPFIEELGKIEVSIYKELVKGNISVYEFEYDEPKLPKGKSEELKFKMLADHSHAKYINVVWLYWRAYNFFKRFNLHLQLESVYMGLGTEDQLKEDRYYHRYNDEDDSLLNETLEKYRTLVRCGELETNRLVMEISNGIECIWIFPFDESAGEVIETKEYCKKVKSYLLQFNHDSVVTLNNAILSHKYPKSDSFEYFDL